MPSGIYTRTEYHKQILAENSIFKNGNKIGPRFKKGYTPANKGKKVIFSKKHKENLSKALMGHKPTCIHKGKESHLWKGGITPLNKIIRMSASSINWRKMVFERDNYTCQKCKKIGGNLQADHIKPFALFPELRFEISNGRTLCIDCHRRTNTYGGKILKK